MKRPQLGQSDAATRLNDELDGLVRQGRRVVRWGGVFKLVGLSGLVVVGLVLVDAGFGFVDWFRMVVGGCVIAVVLWCVVMCGRRRGINRLQLCRVVEQKNGLTQNELINAVGLGGSGAIDEPPLLGELKDRVAARGVRALDRIDQSTVVDGGPLRRGLVWVSIAAGAWALCGACSPRLVTGGLARWVDPFGDHPPYSLTRFEIAVEPQTAVVGDDVVVRAELSGRIPDRAQWVAVDPRTGVESRWPMRRVEGGHYERTLVSLEDPVTFYVTAGGGRSRRYRIEPAARPVTVAEEQVVHDPIGPLVAGDDPGDAWDRVVSDLGALLSKLERLVADSQRLLGQTAGTESWDRQARRLLDRADRITAEVASFGRRWRATDNGVWPERLRGLMSEVQSAMAKLRMTTSRADESAAGSGGGAGDPRAGRLVRRLTDLAARARHDHQVLAEQWTRLQQDGRLVSHRNTGPQHGSPRAGLTPAQGNFQELLAGGQQRSVRTEAAVRSVPPVYREAARMYLWRIAEDQAPGTTEQP